MDFKKVLRAFLSKVLKMTDGDIDAILDASDGTDDSTVAALLEKDKARISELTKPKQGQTFQDGYKKAKSEVLTQFEQELKDKYEIEGDQTGLDLVEAVVAAKAKTGKAKELTDDDVKKHPVYQAAEKAHKKALTDANTQWEAKLNEKETTFKKAETFSVVSKKALDILTAMNPVLPGNATVAANLQKSYINSLKDYDYEIQDNGARIVVMKDGKVVDDGHGHSMDFEKLAKDNAGGYFEFKQNNGGGNAGNKEEGGKGGGSGSGGAAGGAKYPEGIVKPKDWDGVMKIVNDNTIKAEDRSIVLQTWEAEQKAGGTTT